MLITAHAVQRYQERVADVPAQSAINALSCRGVKAAIAFGAKFVKLGGGQIVVIRGNDVVTVLPPQRITRDTLALRWLD